MIVMAATPFSPSIFSMARLKKKVVTAEEIWLTISEEPLAQLLVRTERRRDGLTKDKVPFLPLKNRIPMLAGITYPIPVPSAAP